jgi:hypothetical protein
LQCLQTHFASDQKQFNKGTVKGTADREALTQIYDSLFASIEQRIN